MVIEEQIATKSVELVFENKSAGMQIFCFYNRFINYDKYCPVCIYLQHITNNNNNNNESLFHQKIKLHILCYNNTEDKNYDKNIYIYIYILKKYVITINGA